MPWTGRVQNSPDPWEWFQTKVGPEPFGFELEIGSWKLGGPKLAVVSRKAKGARFEALDSRF